MTDLTPIARLTRDLRTAAQKLSDREARYLVDAYYIAQEDRKRTDNQIRSMQADGEPVALASWLAEQHRALEYQVKTALDKYSAHHLVGEWLRSVKGVGPVIAAGLLAHIDIKKAPHVGHIYSFAGLHEGATWNKGEKRPWNAELKTLCWKLGESFVKVSGDEDARYGQFYVQRKEQETRKNEAGDFADQAGRILASKKIGKDTDAYAWYSGEWVRRKKYNPDASESLPLAPRLPPAHIHARAKRWVVKLFLSHLHEVWYEMEFGEKPAKPYALAHLGHADKIEP